MVHRRAYAIICGAFLLAACSSRVIVDDEGASEGDENSGVSWGYRASGSGGSKVTATGSRTSGTGGAASTGQNTAARGGADNPPSSSSASGGAGNTTTSSGPAGGGGRAGGAAVATNRGGSPAVDAGAGRTGAPDASTTTQSTCTDIQTSDHQGEPCSIWVGWGHCSADWLQGYCNKTCGRCNSTSAVSSSGGTTASSGTSSGGTTTSGTSTGGGSSTTSTASVTPLGNDAQSGWASRYWDCCKPHCAWPGRAPKGTMKMCSQDNKTLSDTSAASSCDNGPAYTCWDMAPWAVSDKLAYGYAATPAGGNDCGKCYQLDFTGAGQHNASDPGSKAVAGKSMIVQATNIGGDVGTGQFDIMVPGGGVGAFNGCSRQWGSTSLGEQYGGFVNECDKGGGGLDALKKCVTDKCNSVFSKSGMEDLKAGCLFYVQWFQTANNPKLRYKEVPCPAAITSKSGMSTN